MQNAFIDPDGSVACSGVPTDRVQKALGSIAALLAAGRATGLPVVHTHMVMRPDGSDMGRLAETAPTPSRRRASS